jgi:CRISPR/Cas system-associated exonuclease Cas4 (RecB family)
MRIINNRKPNNWVKFDRALMRDKRIKSHHKVLYLLFCSLSESVDNVYPSYSWIAEEVGYNYTGEYEKDSNQYERAMKKFVAENLQPIIDIGWIKKTNNVGSSCDYIVYDHDCETFDREQKSTPTVNKKVHTHREQKGTLSYKNIYSYIEEDKDIDFDVKKEFIEFIKLRESKKVKMTQYGLDLLIDKLKKFSKATQIAMLHNSLSNGYTGLFEIKEDKKYTQEEDNTFYPPKFNPTRQSEPEYILTPEIQENTLKIDLNKLNEIKKQLDENTFDFSTLPMMSLRILKNINDNEKKANLIYGILTK